MEHSGHVCPCFANATFFLLMQVWFRVNGLLPEGLQKSLPDRPPEMLQSDMNEGEELKPHLVSYKIQIYKELSAEYNGSYKSIFVIMYIMKEVIL